ncbi:DNA-3-methyladenine glycosylase [Jeotgalibacillus sp. S-D1]|uniref:DNA-3-methyladenine glycosylase n=1 Tax=Jeotgalibacillus sp. S-D1 TaxID=2552189 RepID=UPI00105982BA|nr:DNA-3-methyladenine glycosylase [Jeotgalibacillus sp. S-D1]TDL33178.1 DNA-3-methyladenine glycosylase [Jeotgalibacillus sp. S-D1]
MEPFKPLEQSFYDQPTLELAKQLLGCLLVKETEEGTASGYIVETEAYMGPDDRAAHSFGNRRTKRTEIMFGQAGSVYTYTMHTHTLVNVVSAQTGRPEAILIRAVEPLGGQDLMESRRLGRPKKEWTNGPGKLTKAMGITMADYGLHFSKPPLMICRGWPKEQFTISAGPRIGIDNTGEARDYPWRFWITSSPYVSKFRSPLI